MKLPSLLALAAWPALAWTQPPALSRADSALVGRILLAEDRRDSSDAALTEGASHTDARIRALAQRARGRIRDPRFAARDSLPPLAAATRWPEPSWRLRYRALTARSECGALRAALADSVWPVRLRAADLAGPSCAADDAMVATLTGWVDGLPADASRRARGDVSWHAAAHGLAALARVRPGDARSRIAAPASHAQWQVRMYAARAAGLLADTARLRAMTRDADDNVREAAIEALFRVAGRSEESVYLAAMLDSRGPQAVRAAAIALKGTEREDIKVGARVTYERWALRANASERDVRTALMELAGNPLMSDRPPPPRIELPPRAVELALGADVRLRVTLSDASGGGWFVVRLRGDAAPMMAARVLALASAGYYTNGNWHRVEHDFVIQGAGPGSNEYVGYKDYFRDELSTIAHARGTIGMSTRGHDTGDAQWFINLKDNARLTRDYTVFAEVVEGIEVVDGILEGDVIARMEVVGDAWRRPRSQRMATSRTGVSRAVPAGNARRDAVDRDSANGTIAGWRSVLTARGGPPRRR